MHVLRAISTRLPSSSILSQSRTLVQARLTAYFSGFAREAYANVCGRQTLSTLRPSPLRVISEMITRSSPCLTYETQSKSSWCRMTSLRQQRGLHTSTGDPITLSMVCQEIHLSPYRHIRRTRRCRIKVLTSAKMRKKV